MFEELIDNQISEFNEGLEQVIKDAEITKQNILNCLNAPNLEDQLQQDGEEYIQTINESKEVMDPYYNELKEYLNDEEVLEGLKYFKDKYGDIEEKIRYCIKTIDEIKELNNKIIDIYQNIKKSKKLDDTKYETNNSRILDL